MNANLYCLPLDSSRGWPDIDHCYQSFVVDESIVTGSIAHCTGSGQSSSPQNIVADASTVRRSSADRIGSVQDSSDFGH